MKKTSPIRFEVDDGFETKQINVQPHSYRNLMVLLNDKIYLEGFGQCGGQGRCATCIIEFKNRDYDYMHEKNRNEESTLNKLGFSNHDHRLSCQVLINNSLDGAIISIVEQ